MFLIMAYFPILSGIIGVLSLSIYIGNRIFKARSNNLLLVIGCIGICLTALIYGSFFIMGYMGLGPIAN